MHSIPSNANAIAHCPLPIAHCLDHDTPELKRLTGRVEPSASDSDSTYSTASYAAYRPTYPAELYERILDYHSGPRRLCVDLGCGHGLVTRALAAHFERVIGVDTSSGMIRQAEELTPTSTYPNVTYRVSAAESLPFVDEAGVDMVVAAEAAHWFELAPFFAELRRVVRGGGTLALWAYQGHVFVDHPRATAIYQRYVDETGTGLLGDYWQQPGRSNLQLLLRDVRLPEADWLDERRDEYRPGTQGPNSGQGELLMTSRLTLARCRAYTRTLGPYHAWRKQHPGTKPADQGGSGGDIVDELFDKMVEAEPDWRQAEAGGWKDKDVTVEWGTVVILARKRAAAEPKGVAEDQGA